MQQSKKISKKLEEKYTVKTGNIKKIKPKEIAKNPPDVLVVGAHSVIGRPCHRVKRLIKKLEKYLRTPISKVAILCAHSKYLNETYNDGH